MPEFVYTKDAIQPMAVFSQAAISGKHVFVSGNIGCKKDLSGLVSGDVKEQTRAALKNIEVVLKASGSGLEHIVKANCYLKNMDRDFKPMNEVYIDFFEKGKMPARTCVGVASLPLGASVEIECIAEIP
ncbi:Endoribonuclease L-PSP [Phellopilus nigrolimitatus]|nr:Endoribonuclease L-PSP [Phellopilus nigrolimitatus]